MGRLPTTFEGWWLLHQMFRLRRRAWQALGAGERATRAAETAAALAAMNGAADAGGTSLATLLGHKGDLMVLHRRPSLEALQEAQLHLSRLPLFPFLRPRASYVSVVELSLYDLPRVLGERMAARGLTADSPEYAAEHASELAEQRRRVLPRLFPELPQRRYVCFYPMNRRRGEHRNWYALPIEERARLMHEHGKVGRRYAGRVNQFISGSIGFDDWEWGVDLFADDPLVFKQLIYEMRYEETSVWYAEFGPFWTGLQFAAAELPRLLAGEVPALSAPAST